ncbi:MAG: TetR/AcrR family transcriptional regulator [bacterium]|nr:TetR/AcrR family transcriptional regulator [bacterium]
MDPNKRNKLIASAIELCAERGIHSASTNHIAKAAGVAAGTLFTYFATKEELIQAVYLECKSELIEAMQAELTPIDSPASGQAQKADPRTEFQNFLRHVWSRALEWGLARPTRHKFLRQFGQLPEAERCSPEVTALLETEMHFFYTAIDRAQASGAMIPVDREYMSLLFGAWFDATLDFLRRLPAADRPAAVQTSFGLLWRTVAVDPGPDSK